MRSWQKRDRVDRRASSLRIAFVGLVLFGGGGLGLQVTGAAGTGAGVAIVVSPTSVVATWTPDSDNLVAGKGTIEVDGRPVAGVRVRLDDYVLPAPTSAQGRFVYLVDHTLLGRHVVTVADATSGRVGGQPLSKAQQTELTTTRASVDVAYAVRDLKVSRGRGGAVVSGRLADSVGGAPPVVALRTYELTGTVTDASGNPVAGAQVSTRTLDRDYWTVSTPTDSRGRYSSLFTASSEISADPVPFTVRVSKGDVVYQFLPLEFVYFKRLESARMDIRLPPSGYAMALPRPKSYPGAVFTGIVVGFTRGTGGSLIRPLSVTWPDASGRFQITLPASLAGQKVSLWEAKLDLFSRAAAKPGGAVDLASWPKTLPGAAPRDLVSIRLKR